MTLEDKQEFLKMINKTLLEEYSDCISTVELCSYDDANVVCLCKSDVEVYDFDMIVANYCKKNNYDKVTSVDSLLEKTEKILLIEFKNMDDIPYSEIRGKLHDSLFVMEHGFDIPREKFPLFEIIVVYKGTNKGYKKLTNIRNHFGYKVGSVKDEVEHFNSYKKELGITSYKFTPLDFLEYIS